ncbi:MSHA biogenesis protein MshF [Shewanella sp. H8]|uniref:MSHA biogenesis protein MshF n=1 Tax=Shewanella sp. H8 TaxID=3342676 RepID=UPI003315E1DC
MLSQQKADDDLLNVYARIIAILVLLVLLTVFGIRYLNNTQSLGERGLEFEHNRLLNVLSMVRSQWLASGRPDKMLLSWHNVASNMPSNKIDTGNNETVPNDTQLKIGTIDDVDLVATGNWISMSAQGWPIINTNDAKGCEHLWGQLLASDVQELHITVDYQSDQNICRYFSNKASLRYQLQTGSVIFLIGD